MQAGGAQKKRTGLTQDASDDETIQTERRRVPQPQQRYKPRIIERRNGEFCAFHGL